MGDTCDSSQIAPSAQRADVVVHECTLPDEMAQLAPARGHSSPTMAGTFAKAIAAKRLVLTHFSARYTSNSGEVSKRRISSLPFSKLADLFAQNVGIEALVEAAASAFRGPVLAAHDFLQLHLPRL